MPERERKEHGMDGGYYHVWKFMQMSDQEAANKIKRKTKNYNHYKTKEEAKSHLKSNMESWTDTCHVLHEALEKMPEYNDIFLVFEYVLPKKKKDGTSYSKKYSGVADVILVSADTALVMEFKQNKANKAEKRRKYIEQVEKYRQSLEICHIESKNLIIRSMLVPTKAEGDYYEEDGVLVCPPEQLPKAIRTVMGENPKAFKPKDKWINSVFFYND